jgi:hypothetical protein
MITPDAVAKGLVALKGLIYGTVAPFVLSQLARLNTKESPSISVTP